MQMFYWCWTRQVVMCKDLLNTNNLSVRYGGCQKKLRDIKIRDIKIVNQWFLRMKMMGHSIYQQQKKVVADMID